MENSISKAELTNIMLVAASKSDVAAYADQFTNHADKLGAAASSLLGSSISTIGGVSSLIQETDGFTDTSLLRNRGVALITDKLPMPTQDALGNSIKPFTTNVVGAMVEQASQALGISTTATAASVNLNEIIVSPAVASIQAVAEQVTGIATIPASFISLLPSSANAVISDLITQGSSANPLDAVKNDFKNSIKALDTNIDAILGSYKGGVLNRLITNTTNIFENEITQLSMGLLTPLESRTVIQSILDDEPRDMIANLIVNKVAASFPKVDTNLLSNSIYAIDTSMFSIVNSSSGNIANLGKRTTDIVTLASSTNQWAGKHTDLSKFEFTFVNTQEELITDFREANRGITETVVWWTKTFFDYGVMDAYDLHELYSTDDDTGIPIHYIIKKNGNIQRGRPINIIGDHSSGKTEGEHFHNKYSIGIAFAAGYNCSSDTPNPESFLNAESITSAQWETFDLFMEAFYQVYPGGQAWGSNDIYKGDIVGPGFSVPSYVKQKFQKNNISKSGLIPALAPNVIAEGGSKIAVNSSSVETTDQSAAAAINANIEGYTETVIDDRSYIDENNIKHSVNTREDRSVISAVKVGLYSSGSVITLQNGKKLKVIDNTEHGGGYVFENVN